MSRCTTRFYSATARRLPRTPPGYCTRRTTTVLSGQDRFPSISWGPPATLPTLFSTEPRTVCVTLTCYSARTNSVRRHAGLRDPAPVWSLSSVRPAVAAGASIMGWQRLYSVRVCTHSVPVYIHRNCTDRARSVRSPGALESHRVKYSRPARPAAARVLPYNRVQLSHPPDVAHEQPGYSTRPTTTVLSSQDRLPSSSCQLPSRRLSPQKHTKYLRLSTKPRTVSWRDDELGKKITLTCTHSSRVNRGHELSDTPDQRRGGGDYAVVQRRCARPAAGDNGGVGDGGSWQGK